MYYQEEHSRAKILGMWYHRISKHLGMRSFYPHSHKPTRNVNSDLIVKMAANMSVGAITAPTGD